MLTSNCTQITLHQALILEKNDCIFYVKLDDKIITAKKAFDCLIEPENGDTVIVSICNKDVFILSIVNRTVPADTVISRTGNLHLRITQGQLSLQSKTISLEASDEFAMVSPSVNINAIEAQIKFGVFSLIGKSVECFIDKVKTVGDSIESVFKKMFTFVEYSNRYIDNTELMHCKNLNYTAESMVQIRGKLTQIKAEEDVHVKGERVHIG